MLSFQNDYQEGAHEKILARLIETNLEPLSGYGSDLYCESAKKKIQTACDCPEADVWFLTGGTQTNQTIIDTMLEPYEGVVSAETGHVASHEAGAIEYSGHKVLTIPQHEGKIDAAELETFLRKFWEDGNHEHMVFPGMVYISHPTEYGTLYTKVELENLSAICDAYQIPLFLDGARLGYGLAASDTDVTLPDIARCCHVFYIGGTKVGALCGEAVVFTRHNTPKHFLTRIKQHGALLAKGRLIGIQFDTLFTDNLYFEIGKHAIAMAELLKKGLADNDIPLYLNSPTNQQFLLLTDEQAERLKHDVVYSFWEKPDEDHTVIRLVTDWATTEAQVLELVQVICTCLKNS
ncbi:threonine aldolase family protein [Hominiventricola filiformis]|uniref:Aminotransferase class I/II-fold pyridoxal phosphate-dependent enzyme n=1 Tax=Hominiventricola filiformis TaxID=2885352 RepID=A0AAE3AC30_9FIRM|nr:aminotransferase class I/II-fold pyridoxal phosphate-dependent enzyme [Hominiventricola filiformis]MCC2127268.1 aminotransferase class I/II-fold pyridoxal phosphate-dependent enzyme [Hominiventricola filiformis]